MKRIVVSSLLALLLAGRVTYALADPLSYDDPAVHYNAPAGWERLPDQPRDANDSSAPVAIGFGQDVGRPNQKTISLIISPFQGTLDSLLSTHESELRNSADGTFIDKALKVTLQNGMPAYWLRVSLSSDQGRGLRRFEYVAYDGERSIVLAYTARLGEADEKDAQAALSSLYVVLYPHRRPD